MSPDYRNNNILKFAYRTHNSGNYAPLHLLPLRRLIDANLITKKFRSPQITCSNSNNVEEVIFANSISNNAVVKILSFEEKVSFGPETKYVPVRMYGDTRRKLNPIPENIPLNPFNHTLDRKDYIAKKVVLRIKEDVSKQKERMCLSEHPFGTVKWHHGAYYLLCKGKEKATAELGLSFLPYNLKRAINMIGFERLIAAF